MGNAAECLDSAAFQPVLAAQCAVVAAAPADSEAGKTGTAPRGHDFAAKAAGYEPEASVGSTTSRKEDTSSQSVEHDRSTDSRKLSAAPRPIPSSIWGGSSWPGGAATNPESQEIHGLGVYHQPSIGVELEAQLVSRPQPELIADLLGQG
jgi:hypothetical protein